MARERADYDVRSALIEAAAELIATSGPSALTLRAVADAVGTSTMAVYTHFGGMPQLRRAVRGEGLARLAAHLAAVPQTDDPVADLIMLARAYYENAIANPHLYQAIYMEQPFDSADTPWGEEGSFDAVVTGVARCIAAGRFAPSDPRQLATELWALEHGLISLQLTQLLSASHAVACLQDAGLKLFAAYGDAPEASARSVGAVGRRMPAGAAPLAG